MKVTFRKVSSSRKAPGSRPAPEEGTEPRLLSKEVCTRLARHTWDRYEAETKWRQEPRAQHPRPTAGACFEGAARKAEPREDAGRSRSEGANPDKRGPAETNAGFSSALSGAITIRHIDKMKVVLLLTLYTGEMVRRQPTEQITSHLNVRMEQTLLRVTR